MNNESSGFVLYVTNYPPELTEEGLFQLFSEYGEVLEVFYRPNYAYITYPSYKEAEEAIRNLDKVKPLELHIQISKKQVDKIQNPVTDNRSVQNAAQPGQILPDFRDKNIRLPVQTGPSPNQLKQFAAKPDFPPYRPGPDEDCYYPSEVTPNMFDLYDDPHAHYNTNIMWCRGRTQITPDGRRKVHMGRGYSWLPPPKETYEQQITHIYDQRNPHYYQIGSGTFDDDDGACLLCGQPAEYNCVQCKGFYCSIGCQTRDWPAHQNVCIAMHQLAHIKNGVENGQRAPNSIDSPETPSHGNIFEEPRRTRPSNPLFVQSSIFPMSPTVSALPKSPFKDVPEITEKLKMSFPKMSPQASPKVPSLKSSPLTSVAKTLPQFAFQSPRSALNLEPWKLSDIKTPGSGLKNEDNHELSLKNRFITKEPVEVVITNDLGNSTYWVQKSNERDDLAMFMAQLQEKVKNWPQVNPVLGQIYALPYMGFWHRVKVVKMNPLMIEFADFGGQEEPQSKTFKAMSVKFKELPAFAQKIKFTSNENLKPGETVEIRLVKNEDGLLIVERAAKAMTGVSEMKVEIARDEPVTDLETVFKYLKINEEGFLQIHTPLRNGVYSVALVPESIADEFQELDELLQKVCNQNLLNNSGYKPAVGEMVAAMKDDTWVRGKVIKCRKKIQVMACDEGRILLVDKVLPLSESFSQLPAVGVACEFLEMDKTILADGVLQFVVNDLNTTGNEPCIGIRCTTSDGRKKKCVVKPWIPQPDQKGITYATVKPNSKVIITAYKDHHKMYVRPLDDTEVEKFSTLAQDISVYGSYAQPMTKMPIVGQMVVALYKEDNNFYRALVKGIENDNIQIKYLDFGNLETTSLKHLYEIPLEYKAHDSAVCLVRLKDVPSNVAMKKEVAEYLDLLVGEERQLIVKFEKIENGVELMLNNKESVNGFINEILAPSWKRPEEVNHCFMLDQLSKTIFGKVGDVIELTVLETIADGLGYFMCAIEQEKLEYIDGTMKEEMTKYASSVKDHYIPRTNELCIAPYKENYYRAYCYEPSASRSTATLMLIDYGYMADVPHKDIRHMTQDFMEPSPLGSICVVQNLITEDMDPIPEPLLKRVRELICKHKQVKVKIVDYNEEELTHVVKIEDVARKLKEEMLL